MPSIEEIEQQGKLRRGKNDWLRYQKGERLTRAKAIRAYCYECNGYGELKTCDIKECPLYPYSPYSPKEEQIKGKGTEMTKEKLEALQRGRERARKSISTS